MYHEQYVYIRYNNTDETVSGYEKQQPLNGWHFVHKVGSVTSHISLSIAISISRVQTAPQYSVKDDYIFVPKKSVILNNVM